MIQKHAASSLHYDFRLEVGGVLKSWAVPKGPSTDPRDKRLAVEVEDHPLEYADFEGVIRGGYGAGEVIVWDPGTYRSLTDGPVEAALERGHLRSGSRARSCAAAGRCSAPRGGGKPQWLLVKRRDEGPTPGATRSAPSPSRCAADGRSRMLAAGGGRVTAADPFAGLSADERALLRPAPLPERVEPMKAVLTDERFSDPAGSTSASSTGSAAWRSRTSAGSGCSRATA